MDKISSKIMEICLLAGKLLLQNGAETYRVEDTMTRIASAFGVEISQSYVTPTVIIFSLETGEVTQANMRRIFTRTNNLHKVTRVNKLSREITSGNVTLDEAYERMKIIEREDKIFPIWLQIIAASIASAGFMLMLGGAWNNFLPAVLAGGAGFTVRVFLHKYVPIKFLADFLASVTLALLSVFFMEIGFGYDLDTIIIGSVMPLVPGLLITNAVRDLMAEHLLAGVLKGADALLTAVAVGSGVGLILSIF